MNNYQEHEYVDLGLPSGTLWATCNVGASKPEDYGDYFTWDEGKTAAAKWGKGWGMPSKEQWEELKENTKSSWTTRNGVNGRLFTANNGNSLFLPAAGDRWYDEFRGVGSDGFYWSSSLDAPGLVWGFDFYWGYTYVGNDYRRYDGHSVRAVRSAQLDMNNSQEHEFVDLGLPSGTLWATCNVGASKPEDYGDYFSRDECKAAAAKWGKGWGMPSKEQWEELKDNTKSIWTTRNGVNGRFFTASNGNSLFLPAAGYRCYGELYYAGYYGYYWSSSLYTVYPYGAWGFSFSFGSDGYGMDYYYRLTGQPVRAVRSAQLDMNCCPEHEHVDLGLPSGTLWATCNVGANKPEDNGDYFAWDECKTAAANWGNGWDMPSKEQWEELKENTKSIWTTRNGVNGRLFTASNGNNLFLPAAGCRDYSLGYAGSLGDYWSCPCPFHTGGPYFAWYFYFDSDNCHMYGGGRNYGRSVRGVRSSRQN